ncbi:MAG: LysE family translocator [Hoeflea sp.]|uniref:LysE family translocator n=1 Tax=Hoeflea sp. TaxID=1940281 RepID=UPI00272F0401|nr:LysE family translocator [Hoeflea sp.]MDP2119841.1 LysE family translocator [Hoeflea sp.]
MSLNDFAASFDFDLVVAYAVLTLTLNLTPGPAVLKVVSDSIAHGVGPAHASMAGIFSANMMYALLATAGMGTLIAAFPVLFEIIKWCGAAYLIWLAVGVLRRAYLRSDAQPEPRKPASSGSLFVTSFASQGANPKSVLAFCVTLPVFAGPGDGIELRMLVLAVLSTAIEYPTLLIYSWLGSRTARLAGNTRFKKGTELASASALGLAAMMVARTTLPSR